MNTTEIVALCLTDVEGSSRHWVEHPADMTAALAHLDAIVDRATTRFGGRVVKAKGEGDSHFLVFTLATAAVRAAAYLQELLAVAVWPNGVMLRVRVAIHVGEVHATGDDYLGSAINQAARLRSIAHGGQVVASRTVVDLTGSMLDGSLRFSITGGVTVFATSKAGPTCSSCAGRGRRSSSRP